MNRNSSKKLHSTALAAAIVGILAAGSAAPAAADGLYSYDGAQTLSMEQFLESIVSHQTQQASASANVTGTGTGFTGAGDATVTNNLVRAATLDSVTGLSGVNGVDNSVEFGVLGSDSENAGIGILSGQLATGSVTTAVNISSIGAEVTDDVDGNVTASGNTMMASSLVNNAGNRVEGALPTAAFEGNVAGHVAADFAPTGTAIALDGGIAVGNAQIAAGVSSNATVNMGTIAFTDEMTVPGDSGVVATIADNTISAGDAVNRGDNRISAAAGGAVSYQGSASVANGQAMLGGTAGALVNTVEIGAGLADTEYGGAVSVTGNRISATAQGNEAAAVGTGGALVRGNALTFAEGIDVAGVAGSAQSALGFGNSTTSVQADADLAVVNAQGTQQGNISATAIGTRVGAGIDTLDGAPATATGNHVDASAGGNDAINLIAADSAAFDAGTALANQQSNDHTGITATNNTASVGVMVDNVATDSTVTVADSGVSAMVAGSKAQNVVSLAGANFDASTGNAASITASSAGFTSLDSGEAGIVAANQQGNFGAGTELSATVNAATLGATFTPDTSYGNWLHAEATVTGNAIAAGANGNEASTSVAASGANGALSASLGSVQYNAYDVSATVVQSAGMLGVTDTSLFVWDRPLTVSDNTVTATASANSATNTLSAGFDSSLGLAGGAGASTSAATSTNSADGALVLANNQIDDGTADGGNVTATVIDSTTGIAIARSQRASYTVGDNRTGATATVNSASNALDLSAASLQRTDDGTLAALGNLQQAGGSSTAIATGNSIGFAHEGPGTQYALGLNGAVTGNTISAVARGNLATGTTVGGYGNALTAEGGSLVDTGAASSVASFVGAQQETTGAFVVQNNQDSNGARDATVTDARIGGLTTSYQQGSVISIGENVVEAQTTDNYAGNLLALDFTDVATTGMLQNAQASTGAMDSIVSSAMVGDESLENAMARNAITVQGNSVGASTAANTAANRLDVSADNALGGNSADVAAASVPAGYRGAASSVGAGALVVADYGLLNSQQREGSASSTVTSARIGIFSDSNFDERAISAGVGRTTETSATVAGNAVSAMTQGNSADNRVNLQAASVDASAAIFSQQAVSSLVSATVSSVDVGVQAGGSMSLAGASPFTESAAMPLTVTGNSIAASAGQNSAVNVLSATASSAIAGGGEAGASTDADAFEGYVGAVADFAVANQQSGNGGASALLTGATVGIQAGGAIGSASGTSSLTVSVNTVAAQARGNDATNGVLLDAAGSVSATAAVNNLQEMLAGGPISTMVTGVTVAAGNDATHTGAITSAAMSISGNTVSGAASANNALNAIEVSGAALNGNGVATGAGADGLAGTSTAVANYALNSTQSNAAMVSSTMSGINIGTNVSGGVGAIYGSTSTIGNNSVLASGTGNTASNSIVLSSAMGMPSAALTSSQINTASTMATISGATIGINAGGLSNSPATVTGNTIGASAAGNSAVNHIGIGN